MASKTLISFENRNKLRSKPSPAKITSPLRVTTGRINQADQQVHVNKSSGTTCRHYSFSQAQDDKQASNGRRRFSEKYVPGSAAHAFRKKFQKFGHREKIVLPTKFLLGGNFQDPLNLGSLSDETVNRMLNAVTPVSSPVTVHKVDAKLPVKIPKNLQDPLNLDGGENSDELFLSSKMRPRKRKYLLNKKHKTTEKEEGEMDDGNGLLKPLTVEIDIKEETPVKIRDIKDADLSLKKIADKIVSPVIPQTSPKWKRRRTTSECRQETKELVPRALLIDEDPKPAKIEKTTPGRSKSKRNSTQQMLQVKFKAKNERYAYGNYNMYEGYKNVDFVEDRLAGLRDDLFQNKAVLDIGCNVGHMSLAVARRFSPRKVVGLDIDGRLVDAARKNLLYFIGEEDVGQKKFPMSMKLLYGSIASHPLLMEDTTKEGKFPHNIIFKKANYVPMSDAEVDRQQPEFDVILAFGITKYIHLNYGDEGLKRVFRRMFRQLHPGGKLILQAQQWGSYRKKKKLTEAIFRVYKSIQFRPDKFKEYLLSPEIGFCEARVVAHRVKDCQQSIIEFTKPLEFGHPSPISLIQTNTCASFQSSNQWTPQPHVCSYNGSSSSASPRFEIGSSQVTPCSTCQNTPSYFNLPPSHPSTPYTETTCSSFDDAPLKEAEHVHKKIKLTLAREDDGANCESNDGTSNLSQTDSESMSSLKELNEDSGTRVFSDERTFESGDKAADGRAETFKDVVRSVEEDSRIVEDIPQTELRTEVDRTVSDDPRTVENDPRNLEVDPRNLEADPRNLEVDPRNLEVDPRNLEVDPRNLEVDPRNLEVDPRTLEVDPRTVENTLRAVEDGERTFVFGDDMQNES